MLSIGEFARLAGVSVRMLRHYDAIGLLEPARVDHFTGYRSYSAEQLDRANRLVALKDLGFSLDEVGTLLADGTKDQVLQLLRERRAVLLRQIDADTERVALVEARLRLIQKEDTMSESYQLTELPELRLVQLSTVVEEMSQIGDSVGPLFDRINSAIDSAGVRRVGPGVGLYTGTEEGTLVTAAEQVGDAETPEGLEAVTIPGEGRALTVRFTAPDLSGIQLAWQGLEQEVERQGLVPYGTCREIYHETPFDPGSTGWQVDLQQPVR